MNNKGFAISAFIYSSLIIFSVILFTILVILEVRKDATSEINHKILEDFNQDITYLTFPEIHFLSDSNIEVLIGGNSNDVVTNISYVSDAQDKFIDVGNVSIDYTNINFNALGTYDIIYSVTDSNSNTTTITKKIDVVINNWLPGYDYRKIITIDHNLIDEELTHFPLAIKLTSENSGDFFDEVKNNSLKVAFTKDKSATQLYGEVEYFNNAVTLNAATTNIALGNKNITHTRNTYEESNYTTTKFTDGLTSSYAGLHESTDGNNVTMTLDLGDVYGVDEINVWHYFSDGRTYVDLLLEVSKDGIYWETIFDGPPYAETSSGKSHEFDPKLVRYVREGMKGSSANASSHWVEIEVMGTDNYTIEQEAIYYVSKDDLVISDSKDTILYMYYDNDATDNLAKIGSNISSVSENVWDDNYVLVQHMGSSLSDSTSNDTDGTNSGTTVIDGLNGKARDFDESSYITVTPSYDLTDEFTIMSIAQRDKDNDYQGIYGQADTIWDNTVSYLRYLNDNKLNVGLFSGDDTSSPYIEGTSTSDTALNTYQFLANTFTKPTVKLFINDTLEATSTFNYDLNNGDGNAIIGGYTFGSGLSYLLNGQIDELRVSNVGRSNAWLKAEYESLMGDLVAITSDDSYETLLAKYDFNDEVEPTENLALSLTAYAGYHTFTQVDNSVSMTMYDAAQFIVFKNPNNYEGKKLAYSGYMKKNGVPSFITSTRANTYNAGPSVMEFDSNTGYFEIIEYFDSDSSWIFHSGVSTVEDDVVTITNFQVEEKDHVTPFTALSRTGDIWDSSDSRLNIALDSAHAPKWDEGSYYFDGNETYIVGGDNFSPIGSQTLSAWIKPTTTNSLQGIVSFHDHGTTSNLGLNIYSGKISASIGYTDSTREYSATESTASVTVDVWTHVSLVYDQPTNTIKFYINGELDSEHTLVKTVDFTSDPIVIGLWSTSYINGDYDFNGNIDEVRVNNIALTSNQVKFIYDMEKGDK